jgi:hypothetical protein
MLIKEFLETNSNSIEPGYVFALLPEKTQRIYNDYVKKAADSLGLVCESFLDFKNPGDALRDILERIQKAEILIYDITDLTPNVMWELGLGLAIKDAERVIVIREESDSSLPFNIYHPTANDIYIRILEALEEPLLDKKTAYGDVSVYRNGEGKVVVEPASIVRYRRAVEKALQFRKPCLLFDEAQHLLDIGGLTLEDTMDWIKSIANMGQCLIVLFGTYEMLDFVDLNEQLMCRSKIIHFHRYKNKVKDLEVFDRILLSFQMNMPLAETPNLLEYSDYLYERTGGCVGNLYNWLLGAYDVALTANDQTLTLEHLTSTVPLTEIQAAKLDANIAEDEERFATEIGDEKEIQRKKSAKKGSEKASKLKTTSDKPLRKSRSNRVGERRPVRDKIGGVRKAA